MAETVIERLNSVWASTDRIFGLLKPEAYLAQPIALRHPFIFYVGHLPAFAWNHVGGGVLGRPSLNLASTSSSRVASIPTRMIRHVAMPTLMFPIRGHGNVSDHPRRDRCHARREIGRAHV